MRMTMRRTVIVVIGLFLTASVSFADQGRVIKAAPGDDLQLRVYFSPRGGCANAIIDAVRAAKSEVLVQAYSFTSAPIAKALVDAHKRGVHVEIVLDKSQRSQKKYGAADFTAHAGIRTYIDAAHAIAHNKIMIIDKTVVITGSFNFTKAAEEKNAENLLIIRSKELARVYIQNWEKHKGHSERYGGR